VKRVFYVFLRFFIGALFMVSGFSKLMAPYQDFLASIYGYRIVMGPLALWIALALPWAELIVGLYAVLGLWTRPALLVLWGMNFVFLAGLASVVLRGLPLESCGCFGEGGPVHLKPSEMIHLDLALTLIFVLLWRARETSAFSIDDFLSRPSKSARTPLDFHRPTC
jgi:uncharacterized membrane protein YphA (DoxX/SURF4 family)